MIVTFIFALGLIVYIPFLDHAKGSFPVGPFVEGLFLIAILIFNNWLVYREHNLLRREMSNRIQFTLDAVKKHGLNEKDNIQLPTTIPTVAITRVVRGLRKKY